MALALYRKYRPKLLSELLGQDITVEILKNAAKQGRLAHAYLFYGPRGSGKTTLARIVAKLANCETRRDDAKFRELGEPCNKCRTCLDIDEGRGLDVAEIDAASNRGIDEIRNLKEGIRLSPLSYQYKVFIIDEVHMLTTPAFNALLKTMEEPPQHAIFILATTEFEKIPATILSRAQKFALKKIPAKLLIEKLRGIAQKEKINIDADALELIALSAEGSARDAESLLDQLSRGRDKINLKDVEETLGRTGLAKLDELADLIFKKDLENALKLIAELDSQGVNLVQFTKDFIHYLRRVLTLKMSPGLVALMANDFTAEEIENIKKLGRSADTARLIALLKSLIQAYGNMRHSPFAIVPLEVAIIENLGKEKS